MEYKVALFGLGTVGLNVYKILQCYSEFKFNIQYVVVRDLSKYKNCVDSHIVFSNDLNYVLKQIPDVDIVIETIGGISDAWKIIQAGLQNGKIVISANKALISKYMFQIQQLTKKFPESKFGFEASVGGGIPILKSLRRDYIQFGKKNRSSSDAQKSIQGILNGTCNFILSNMDTQRQPYNIILKEAQHCGFAEADPSADVLGLDTLQKLQILIRVAFGISLSSSQIICEGLVSDSTHIEKIDFEYATLLASKIKLIAKVTVKEDEESIKVSASVFPTLVPVTRSIAHVNNEMNMVSMSDDLVENITVVGPGAGGNATAHSVVSDVLELITNQAIENCFGTSLIDFNRVEIQPIYSKFYVRIDAVDQNGIIENVGSVCKLYDIGINEILQTKSYDENIAFVLTTHSTTYNKIKELKKTLVGFHWCAKTPYIMMISD